MAHPPATPHFDWMRRMDSEPIITWAGPLERVVRAANKASDLFEARRYDEGMDELAAAQRALTQTVEFIVANRG